MLKFLASRYGAVAAIVLLLGGIVLGTVAVPRVRDMRIECKGEPPQTARGASIGMPGKPGTVGRVTFTLEHGAFSPVVMNFIPDDYMISLAINGRNVPLSGVSDEKRHDYSNGFHLDIGSYLQAGRNQCEAMVGNAGGNNGFSVRESRRDPVRLFALFLLAGGVTTLLVHLGCRRRWPTAAIVVVCLAAMLRIWTFNAIYYDARPHDLGGASRLFRPHHRTEVAAGIQ